MRLQPKIPSQVSSSKNLRQPARQPEGSFGIQAQLSRICHAALHHLGPEARAKRAHSEDNCYRLRVLPEPTGSWRMTNRFGIYLCRGSCRRKESAGGRLAIAPVAAGRVLRMLLVRLGPRETGNISWRRWQLGQLPRLENRRLGFEPLC